MRFIFIYIIDLIKFQDQIYPHHIISMIINFIVLISFILFQIKNIITHYYYIPYIIIINYSYSLSFILIKYLNIKYFMNIYLIASIIGLFKLFFKLYIVLGNSFREIKIILSLICLMIHFVSLFLIYYVMAHLGLISSLFTYFILYYISLIIQKIFILQKIFLLFALILSLISAMIYLEILELKFCGLNDGLNEKIKERAEQEKTLLENSSLILSSEE